MFLTIEKIECKNHLLRNFYKKLKKLLPKDKLVNWNIKNCYKKLLYDKEEESFFQSTIEDKIKIKKIIYEITF